MNSELDFFLIFHKQNEDFMAKRYVDYFRKVVESNPCETIDLFKALDKCTTWMGGTFINEAYAASKAFLEIALSVFMDFNKGGDESNNMQYLNDERLLDVEVLANYLLNPAYLSLATELISDKSELLDKSKKEGIIVFAVLGAFVLIITIIGKAWLIQHLRRSMYETNVMLCTLPPEMILSNDRIAAYLSGNSALIKH